MMYFCERDKQERKCLQGAIAGAEQDACILPFGSWLQYAHSPWTQCLWNEYCATLYEGHLTILAVLLDVFESLFIKQCRRYNQRLMGSLGIFA